MLPHPAARYDRPDHEQLAAVPTWSRSPGSVAGDGRRQPIVHPVGQPGDVGLRRDDRNRYRVDPRASRGGGGPHGCRLGPVARRAGCGAGHGRPGVHQHADTDLRGCDGRISGRGTQRLLAARPRRPGGFPRDAAGRDGRPGGQGVMEGDRSGRPGTRSLSSHPVGPQWSTGAGACHPAWRRPVGYRPASGGRGILRPIVASSGWVVPM